MRYTTPYTLPSPKLRGDRSMSSLDYWGLATLMILLVVVLGIAAMFG